MANQLFLSEGIKEMTERRPIMLAPDQHPWIPEQEENRKIVRKLVLERILEPANYWITQETRRRRWFKRKLGIEFPESGRLVLEWQDFDSLQGLYDKHSYEWSRVEGVHSLRFSSSDSISQLTEKDFFRGELSDRNPSHRERSFPIVLSIALEDFLFCSDYAAYSSCLRMANGSDFPGAGRIWATVLNSAVLIREDLLLTSIGYHYEKIGGRTHSFWADFPELPKKLGRRILYFNKYNPTIFSIGRSYGILNWACLPVIDAFKSAGLDYFPNINEEIITFPHALKHIAYYQDHVRGDPSIDSYLHEFNPSERRLKKHKSIILDSTLEVEEDESYCCGACDCRVDPEDCRADSDGGLLCYNCWDKYYIYCEVCDEDRGCESSRDDIFFVVRSGHRSFLISCRDCIENVFPKNERLKRTDTEEEENDSD